MFVGGIKLTSPTWWEFQYLQNSSKITVVCIPGWGARLLSLGYTIASLDHQFLLCLHPLLAWWVSAWTSALELRKVMEAEWSLFPVVKNCGHRKDLCPGAPQSPAGFHHLQSFTSTSFSWWHLSLSEHKLSIHLLTHLSSFSFPQTFSSVQSLSRVQLCDYMNHSMPDFPVHHQLPEFTQTHAHWVSDAIQPSHPLSSPPPLALNLSQHQGLFQWVNFSHEVAKVLEFQLQHQSFQWTPRTDLL